MLTNKELTVLIKEFKSLIIIDATNGITSSDAREVIYDWLIKLDKSDMADRFVNQIYKYQTSEKIKNIENDNF
jgi:hypothetical protein